MGEACDVAWHLSVKWEGRFSTTVQLGGVRGGFLQVACVLALLRMPIFWRGM